MSDRIAHRTVSQCQCCLLPKGDGTCTAFSDPSYQWRNGACWGRCESAEEMVRRLEAITTYTTGNSGTARAYRLELAVWRELAREEGGEIA